MDVNAKTPCNISLELVERLFSGIAVGDSPYSSITLKPIDESQPWLHIEHGGDLYGSPNAVCILAADGDPSKAVKECMTANPLVEGSLRELAFEFMAGGPVGDIMISGLGEGYTVTRDDHTDNNISIQITDQETGRIGPVLSNSLRTAPSPVRLLTVKAVTVIRTFIPAYMQTTGSIPLHIMMPPIPNSSQQATDQ